MTSPCRCPNRGGARRVLVESVLLTPDLHAPGLLGRRGWVPQLREGDAHLGGPAERVDRGFDVPHRVPRFVAAAAQAVRVEPRPGRIHLEEQPADVVVIGVEDDLDVVGARVGVAADEARAHAGRARIVEHPRAHVERRLVVREPHLGALGRGLALLGLILPETGRRGGGSPDGLVETTVEPNRAVERDRAGLGGGGRVDVLRGGGQQWGGRQRREDDDRFRHAGRP